MHSGTANLPLPHGHARRYHWFSQELRSFVDDPHPAGERAKIGQRDQVKALKRLSFWVGTT